MLVVGIILTLLGIVGLVLLIAIRGDENEDAGFFVILTFILWIGFGFLIVAPSKGESTEKSLKDNTLSIEIRQEIINGQEISRDTIYIFTPKK